MSKDCPIGQFWNGVERICTSCQELCLEVHEMMRSVCCDSLLQCRGGLPDAAQATCPTSSTNATNITSSTINIDGLWIGIGIAIAVAMIASLSIGFVILRQRMMRRRVPVEPEAAVPEGEAGGQAVEERLRLMHTTQPPNLPQTEESQELRSFRQPPNLGSEGQPPAAGRPEDSGNVSSASTPRSDATPHLGYHLSASPVMQPVSDDEYPGPQEETSQQAKIRLPSGAVNAHDMSTMDTRARSMMDTRARSMMDAQARSTSSNHSQVSHNHSNMETQMKSV